MLLRDEQIHKQTNSLAEKGSELEEAVDVLGGKGELLVHGRVVGARIERARVDVDGNAVARLQVDLLQPPLRQLRLFLFVQSFCE